MSDTRPQTILCVDDDKDTCEVLGYLFPEYEFVFAHNLEGASPLVQSRHFDLYMLDNWLPDGSGIQLCELIRSLHPDAPIIFTSGVGAKKEIDRAYSAGATRYLVKPVDPDALGAVIKELIGN